MRLTEFQLTSIKECFNKFFAGQDHLWLFGSRADMSKKGGDIDLYIETHNDDLSEVINLETKFKICMIMKIGDQKIDIVTNLLPLRKEKRIYTEARKTGILIR